MSKFVRLGNVIVNADNIIYIIDNGGKREIIMLHNFSYETEKTFGELLGILNGKEPSYDWIPCSERLPKQEEQVFVYLFGNSPYIAWYNHLNKKWCTDDFELNADEEPKAWLPLPMLRWGE